MVSDELDRPEPLQSIADTHKINLSAMPRVEGALAAAIEAGRAIERAAIAGWLRSEANIVKLLVESATPFAKGAGILKLQEHCNAYLFKADAIERGEHIKEGEKA